MLISWYLLPIDLSKVSDVVKNDTVKKDVHENCLKS